MWIIILKIVLLVWLAGLNWARGYHWRPLSIALMVITLGGYFALLYHTWWLLFAVGVPFGALIGTGDSNRWLWCGLVAFGISIALLITHHLVWWLFVPYILFNSFLGWLMVNKLKAKQLPTDLVTGAGFGLIVFLA